MSNLEYAFISRIVQDADFHSVEKMGITDEYLSVPEVREVFRYIRDMYHAPGTTGLVPSQQMIGINYPGFHWTNAFDQVPILAAQLRKEKVKSELVSLSLSLQEQAELDPLAAAANLKAITAKIASLQENSHDLTMGAAARQLEAQYDMVANSGGVIGIPYPWEVLNSETQGMQDAQFIIIFGRPKSMKSWIAINMGVHAYIHARKRVLIYTKEMTPLLVAGRAASIIARVDYKAFKNGRLQPALKQRTFEILRELMDDEVAAGSRGMHQPCFVITSDHGSRGGSGVAWLQAKIREVQPDLVIVDGMYLMKDDRSGKRDVEWKAIAHISQDLKLTAQEFNIPIIGVTQANRNSEGKESSLAGLGYTDAFAQDADAVFEVRRKKIIDPQTQQKRTELYLNCPGLREGELEGIVINGHPGMNFDYIRTLTGEAEQEEYGEDQPRGRRGGGGRGNGNYGGGAAPAAPVSEFRRAPIITGR